MRNMWLRVDYDRGEVLADGIMQLQGTFFSAVRVATPQQHAANSSGLVGDENEGDLVRLKVCKRNVWLEVRGQTDGLMDRGPDAATDLIHAMDSSKSRYSPVIITRLGITAFSEEEQLEAASFGSQPRSRSESESNRAGHPSGIASISFLKNSLQGLSNSWFRMVSSVLGSREGSYLRSGAGERGVRPASTSQTASSALSQQLLFDEKAQKQTSQSSLSLFRVSKQRAVRGVNLGGLFIPEVWMQPGFFQGSGLGWSGSLCRMVNFSRPLAEERMAGLFRDWLSEADFQEIAARGFNSVRVPVGYWNIIADPYKAFAPADLAVSHRIVDWIFDMAEKYGLSVLLDLHGAPGSQNGDTFKNSLIGHLFYFISPIAIEYRYRPLGLQPDPSLDPSKERQSHPSGRTVTAAIIIYLFYLTLPSDD